LPAELVVWCVHNKAIFPPCEVFDVAFTKLLMASFFLYHNMLHPIWAGDPSWTESVSKDSQKLATAQIEAYI
jgi:hypothetical protein